ncbi:MAG: deaminase [Bacteroidales bacterium]|jgi:dCMP deaminase|nr:deaminase [Bacteroidales bacterium]
MVSRNTTNSKNDHFLKQTLFIATESKDPSTKVGAIITDPKGRVVSQGRNGFPMGVNDTEIPREIKYLRTLHAELNCILFAKQDLDGHTIYISAPPCAQCMAAIIQSGITTVICYKSEITMREPWITSCNEAVKLAEEAVIIYIQVDQ